MKIIIIFLGLLVGLVSGIMVYFLIPVIKSIGGGTGAADVLIYSYGILYGIITAGFFSYFVKKMKLIPIFLWTIVSGLSYCLGVISTISTSDWSTEDGISLENYFSTSFFIGGVVGSFVLVLGFCFIFNRISYKLSLLILVTGGLSAGVTGALWGNMEWSLYVVWQTLVTGLLASSIKDNGGLT